MSTSAGHGSTDGGELIHPTEGYVTWWWSVEMVLWIVVTAGAAAAWVVHRKSNVSLRGAGQLHRIVILTCALFTCAAAARLLEEIAEQRNTPGDYPHGRQKVRLETMLAILFTHWAEAAFYTLLMLISTGFCITTDRLKASTTWYILGTTGAYLLVSIACSAMIFVLHEELDRDRQRPSAVASGELEDQSLKDGEAATASIIAFFMFLRVVLLIFIWFYTIGRTAENIDQLDTLEKDRFRRQCRQYMQDSLGTARRWTPAQVTSRSVPQVSPPPGNNGRSAASPQPASAGAPAGAAEADRDTGANWTQEGDVELMLEGEGLETPDRTKLLLFQRFNRAVTAYIVLIVLILFVNLLLGRAAVRMLAALLDLDAAEVQNIFLKPMTRPHTRVLFFPKGKRTSDLKKHPELMHALAFARGAS